MTKKDIQLICLLNKNWRPTNLKIKKAKGQTNRNWIVQYQNKKFFVRLPLERADIIDRATEAKNILILTGNKKVRKILPRYYLYIYQGKNILHPEREEVFNLPDGTMVTEFIPGRLMTMSLFKKRIYQQKLARMFHIFHTSRIKFKNKYDVFSQEITKYRLISKKYPISQLVDKKTVSNIENIEKEAKTKIPSLKKGISTHNDFIFQNFIIGRNGKIYLIDFEYAGLNIKGGILYDFGFLLADNFFRNPPLTPELFEKFLKVADRIYQKKLNRNQIYWSAIAATLVMFWWGIIRYFDVKTKKEKDYFKNYILKRAKGIEFLPKLISKKRED